VSALLPARFSSSSFSSANPRNTRSRLRRLVRRVGVTAWSSASDRSRGAPGPRVSARRAGAALGSRGRERRRSRRLLQQLWRPRSRGVSCAPLFPSSQLGCGAAGQVLQDADGRVVVFRLGAPCSTASSLCEANPKSVSEHPSVSLQHPTRRSVVNTAHRLPAFLRELAAVWAPLSRGRPPGA